VITLRYRVSHYKYRVIAKMFLRLATNLISKTKRAPGPRSIGHVETAFLGNFSRRHFATKHEDLSLEGRYSTALLRATSEQKNLDKVFEDLSHLRNCVEESADFKLFIETPAIQPADKIKVFEAMGQKYGYQQTSVNYLKVLLENKRLFQLKKMINNFETFYRAEKGQMLCQVISAITLSKDEKGLVEAALASKAKGSKLIITYTENPGIEGGLLVKIGESVLDFSVSSKLDRVVAELSTPM